MLIEACHPFRLSLTHWESGIAGAWEMERHPVYNPRILRDLVEICACMGVGREKILQWLDEGAPITVERDGMRPRYSAEAAELQHWRLENARKKAAG